MEEKIAFLRRKLNQQHIDILYLPGYNHSFLTPQMSFASDTVELLETSQSLLSPGQHHKHFLGKLGLRKPSVLSISSAASSQGSVSPAHKRSSSPMQDEEKRKILKMLISPNSERKPTKNLTEFMSLADITIKAAKSAENLSTSSNQVKEFKNPLDDIPKIIYLLFQ